MKNSHKLGALYIAFGKPYLAMALYSASTLRKTNPEMPICIINNVTKTLPNVDYWDDAKDHFVFLDKNTAENRLIKTSLNKHSPFEKTIFIDCDTVILGSLGIAEKLLDYFDIAMRLNRDGQKKEEKGNISIFDNIKMKDLPHWNSGVVLFRKGAGANNFFTLWHTTYLNLNVSFDQISLVNAIFNSSARFCSLDDKWNKTPSYSFIHPHLSEQDKIMHYTSRISPKTAKKLLFFESVISNSAHDKDTLNYIKAKRKQRRETVGLFRYILLWLYWTIFSGR